MKPVSPELLDSAIDVLSLCGVAEVKFAPRVHLRGEADLIDLVKLLGWEVRMNVEPAGKLTINGREYDYRLEELPSHPDKVIVLIDLAPGEDPFELTTPEES